MKASTVDSIAPLLFTGLKEAETTSSLSAIKFGRSKERSTSSGGTWDLRKPCRPREPKRRSKQVLRSVVAWAIMAALPRELADKYRHHTH